jgi:hypothetical protein
LFSEDDEYIPPKTVAQMIPGCRDCAACLFNAARLDLNPPPEVPMIWERIHPNQIDYHSDPIEINSTFWLPDLPNWWHQHEETHSQYNSLSNVVCEIFCIITHGAGVEGSFSLQQYIIAWKQSKTTGKILGENVVVRQYARANNWILGGNNPELHTTKGEHDIELQRAAE